jgi:nicotinate phosphoribosyltransferase
VVRAQVFIRKGPGELDGIDEAAAVLGRYAPEFFKNGGRLFALRDGEQYSPGETLMVLEGPLQDIVELETMYLGVLSAAVTARNDGVSQVDCEQVESRMRQIVALVDDRPVSYFGARHWSFREDTKIARAAYRGGARSASTDAGSHTFGAVGVGTIPHVLENAFAARFGKTQAVVEATKAFDRIMPKYIPRIALIDYNNREIDDSLATAAALGANLFGVRVDTPGENVPQGGIDSPLSEAGHAWREKLREKGIVVPDANDPDSRFWYGTGVSVSGVYALRQALDDAGFSDVRLVLTSGFGDLNKVAAFVKAEALLGIKLFDSLGVGGLYPARAATMDVVGLREADGTFSSLSKVGRSYKANPRMEEIAMKELVNA